MDGRRSSMQDIPLNSSARSGSGGGAEQSHTDSKDRRTSRQPQPTVQGAPLLQSEFEEYNMKAKVKMLPLLKIRPTSECNAPQILGICMFHLPTF